MTVIPAPRTEAEFRDRMEELIRGAETEGIDVRRNYVFCSDDERPDWDVELFELVQPEDPFAN